MKRYFSKIPHPSTSFRDKNISMLRLVVRNMGPLARDVAFLGGTVLPLLIAPEFGRYVRLAKDVDFIADHASKKDIYLFEDEMRERGFKKRRTGAVSQWAFQYVNIDELPADPEILSFNNRWCAEALLYAQRKNIGDGLTANLISPAYFLGVKFDAFHQRGRENFIRSYDVYDIVVLIAGNPDVVFDVQDRSSDKLKHYLSHEFQRLLDNSGNLSKLIPTLFPKNIDVQQRIPKVVSCIQKMIHMEPALIS